MMQEHLVMTVRAHARCDFALILRTARPESENQHHEVIEPEAPPGAVHPRQVIARPLAVGFAGERVSVVRSPEPARGEVLLRVRSRADRGPAAHSEARAHPAVIDGVPGILVMVSGRPVMVMAFMVADGAITAIRTLTDPDRLAQVVPSWVA
jgi:hypothetical protein